MKKYLLWLYNGEGRDDDETNVIGLFSSKRAVEKAQKEAHAKIEQKFRDVKPIGYYHHVTIYGMLLCRNFSLHYTEIQEDSLIAE